MDVYQMEIEHSGLHKYRLIRGRDAYIVRQKANAQQAVWDEIWAKTIKRENRLQKLQSKIEAAAERTDDASRAIEEIENILTETLEVNDAVDWEALKDRSTFPTPEPKEPPKHEIPTPPSRTDFIYQPTFGLLEKFIPSMKKRKIQECDDLFKEDYNKYYAIKENLIRTNEEALAKHAEEQRQWKLQEAEFYKKQVECNKLIDGKKQEYQRKMPEAIVDYCELVLSNSEYPDYFPQEFDLDFSSETGILIVDYSMPSPDLLPRVKEVRYVKSRDELVEVELPDSAINKLYDNLIYQIALRTIHELYEGDTADSLKSIVFNGWVDFIDKATGKEGEACIISIQANRDEFLAINLAKVDPKICFKNLKGVGSSKLHIITPVAPIMNINREDKRFISSYAVAAGLDESYNIAAMDWADFEHLIRELFEKEFAQSGGEVKVTQASRDGGVDAVAFDPDPIRGGKIVIQAKRYVNTVSVGAVRDLYGTVINEGATKGILISTADYGPDAYEFAKGKPLTLLNGGNLLSLLEKHGHKAKIDLKEAKLLLSEREKNKG